jgi:H+-transporting ATPase
MWGLRPTTWLVFCSIADVLIITVLASRGIAMAPLLLSTLACEFAAAVVYGLILDGIKIPIFARLGIA